MMVSPERYRKELENLTPEELYEKKKKLEKFINDYENNNLSQQDCLVKPSPQTRYELYKEYLDEVIDEIGIRKHQSEMTGVKVSKSQCADCKNYLGDINCKIYGEIASDILGNKKACPERKVNIVKDENSFEFLNNKIEKLTKELAEAYRNNDQEQITKLQDKIKEATDKQLKKDVDKLVKEDIKKENGILGKATYINRERLLNKLGYYLGGDKDKRKRFSNEKDFILDEIKIIKEELQSNSGIEIPFTPCIRAQHCINEFVYYLERNQTNDCLMDIYEVISSDKNDIYNPLNSDFKYSTYIGNEEKSIVLNMVNRLEAHINNSNNQYSTEKLFEKAKANFNFFVENEYGANKFLSFPLPVSHNKLKSLILLSAVEQNAEIYNCGYVLIDTITGNIEYKLEPEHLLLNDPKLNLSNFIPKKEISINSKEEYDNLYKKYFKLLDDLILMYGSKKRAISSIDKVEEFLNIYKNIASESEQIEYSLNNEFLSWCLISVPKQEIKKIDFEKSNTVIRETYIDENGRECERERIIEMPVFPITDLSKIAENIYNKIEKLPEETEFTIQQFLKDYNIEEKDKFSICDYVFDLCNNNNVVIVEKMNVVDFGLPWNIIRIKK